MRHLLFWCGIILFFQSCVELSQPFSKLPPGRWRAVLEIDQQPIAGVPIEIGGKEQADDFLPFLFDVVYDSPEEFHLEIINGDEKIIVNDIIYGRDKATAKDTIQINFPVFDTYLKAIYEENIMEGYWQVNYRENYRIPFKAYHGQNHLFSTDTDETPANVDGTWEATFEIGTEDEYPAIGEFVQNNSDLRGTFLTETGDYRYLSGQVIGEKLFLSTFDGSHAFLFEGKLLEDGTISGIFRSGKHYTTDWIAERNPEASLSDAYNLTQLKENSSVINFSFPNLNGEVISLEDNRYTGKPKLVQIFGTWCPNCMDETKFLLDYYQKNPELPVEIIAIGFERYRDEERSMESLQRFKDKLNVPYEVLLGGYYDKSEASEKFPMLNRIISYPTLLFLDRNNEVKKIHTGFSGPATSGYDQFKIEFQESMEEIINS